MTIKREDAFIFFLVNAHLEAIKEKRGWEESDRCQTIKNHHTRANSFKVLLVAKVGDIMRVTRYLNATFF